MLCIAGFFRSWSHDSGHFRNAHPILCAVVGCVCHRPRALMKEIWKQHESVSSFSTLVTENIFLKRQNGKPPAATKSHVVNWDDVVWPRSWGLVGWTLEEEIQSSKYDHRIFGQLTSGQQLGSKRRPRGYWLRQHWLVCLSWNLPFAARGDTQDKNHFWPTWRVTRLRAAAHQTDSRSLIPSFFYSLERVRY